MCDSEFTEFTVPTFLKARSHSVFGIYTVNTLECHSIQDSMTKWSPLLKMSRQKRRSTAATSFEDGTTLPKLQALVYDILPSTTAVFSYAIGSRKLSANEQFFCWYSNSSKFVTNNLNKTRRVIYSRQQSLHQHK